MFRRILLAVVGLSLLLTAPALAKTTTRSCSSVTVGQYQATKIRTTSALGCKAARSDLSLWLKKPNKLPTNKKSWHAKLVKGTWQMAYGRHPVSLYFTLAKTAPALAKTTTRSCSSVTVGQYQATKIRTTSALGCKAARSDLSLWLKKPNKLPTNKKSWHAKLVKGTWQMAYGRHPVSLYFTLAKLKPKSTPPKSTPPKSTPPKSRPPAPTKQGQSISFTSTAPLHPVANGLPYTVSATASSGLPVALTLDGGSSGCSLSGSTVTFTAVGTCVIDANQAGNTTYNAATQVQQSLTVTQAKTVVTLTFDDGYKNMITNVLPVMQANDLHGTFYIISGAINANTQNITNANYMTWSDLQTLYNDGNEIAGHTVLHEDLAQVGSTAEAIQEACQDRYDLMNPPTASGLSAGALGPITDMAWPDGDSNATVEAVVKACGYDSARTVAGVDDPTIGSGLSAVPLTTTDQYNASTVDTAATDDDPFVMPTTPSIGTLLGTYTAAGVEAWVTNAETADASLNGWVSLTLHDVCTIATPSTCNSPDGYQMDAAEFTALASWLHAQEVAGNIVVKTMAQVVGGPNNPAVAPATTSPGNEWSSIAGWGTGFTTVGTTATPAANATFTEAANPTTNVDEPGGAPCYQLGQYGTNTVTSGTNTVTNGVGTEGDAVAPTGTLTISSYTGGDAGILVKQDAGECAPILAPGTYTISDSFTATANAHVFLDVFLRSDTGNWSYYTESAPVTATGASQTMPSLSVTLPAGYDGISYGVSMGSAGTLSVSNYSLTG